MKLYKGFEMKTLILGTGLIALLLTGCQLPEDNSSYINEEEFQTKYDIRLQEDPNYKLNVNDLNIKQDIEDDSIFCYSTATTPKEKMQKLIEGLRLIPIDCNGGIDTSGNYECLLESEVLDTAAQENSIALASGDSSKSLSDRASENGYNTQLIVGGTIIQDGDSEDAMIAAVESKMKSDANFCSYVVSRKTKDLGVGYDDANGKRYWTIILGDDAQ